MFNSRKGFKLNSIMSVVMIFLRVIKGFLVPKLIQSPEQYGLYTSIGLYTKYIAVADLGNKNYLNKQIPKLFIKEDNKNINKLLSESISFHLFVLGIISLIFLSLSVFYIDNKFYSYFYFLFVPYSILFHSRLLLNVLTSSIFDFKAGFWGGITVELISLILIIPAVNFYGALGGFFSLILSELLSILVFLFQIKKGIFNFHFQFSFNWVNSFKLFLKQFQVNLADVVLNSFDLVFISIFFNVEIFGLYSVGLGIFWALMSVSSVFTNVLFPRLMAISDDPTQGKGLMKHTLSIYFMFCQFAILFLQVLGFLIITFFLHKYTASIFFLAPTGIIMILRGASVVLRIGYISFHKEIVYTKQIIVYVTLTFVVNVILFYLFHNIKVNVLVIAFGEFMFFIYSAYKLLGKYCILELQKHFITITLISLIILYFSSYGLILYIFIAFCFILMVQFAYLWRNKQQYISSFNLVYSEK